MKWTGLIAFAAALGFHALMLFGVRWETSARPLEISETLSTVDVNLVAAVEPPPAEPMPEPNPEPPTPLPEPPPEPPATAPTPEPVIPAPEPMPTATPQPAPPVPKPTRPVRTSATAKASPAPASAAPSAPPRRSLVSRWFSCMDAAPGSSTARPSYRRNPPPIYPEAARRNGQQGLAILNVWVKADGKPGQVALKQSSGFPVLDDAALAAVRRWSFEPARAGGLPVESRVDVPVRFSLGGRE